MNGMDGGHLAPCMDPKVLYCQTATNMCHELKRSKKWLPPYNSNGVKEVIAESCYLGRYLQQETLLLKEQGQKATDLAESQRVPLLVHQAAIQRQKRLILTYLMHRIDKIRGLWWETGPAIPDELRAVLSPQELDFLAQYDKLMTTYSSNSDLNLTSDQTPPKDNFIAVQAVKGRDELGEIMTSTGPVTIGHNSEVMLRRTDAEMLIRRGQLVQAHSE